MKDARVFHACMRACKDIVIIAKTKGLVPDNNNNNNDKVMSSRFLECKFSYSYYILYLPERRDSHHHLGSYCSPWSLDWEEVTSLVQEFRLEFPPCYKAKHLQ